MFFLVFLAEYRILGFFNLDKKKRLLKMINTNNLSDRDNRNLNLDASDYKG
jgi:hypothetical protein